MSSEKKLVWAVSEKTVMCNILILNRDIGWGCRCAVSWCDLNLTFDLVIVILTFIIMSRLYVRYSKV